MSCICVYVFLAAELLSYDYFPVIHPEKVLFLLRALFGCKDTDFQLRDAAGCRSSVNRAGFFIVLPHEKQPRESSRRSRVAESYDPHFCSLLCG